MNQEETIEDIVKQFHADARLHQHLLVGQIAIEDIYIGLKKPGTDDDRPEYSSMLYYNDVFNMVGKGAFEHIEHFVFSVENDGLTGQVTVFMNSINRTIRCDTDKLVVKEPYAAQGFVIAGLSLKWGAAGGDMRLPNRAERRKKKTLNRH